MRNTNIIVLISFLVLFTSCDENRIYEKNEDFEYYEWEHDNKINFEVDIKDTDAKSLLINFRHTYFFETRNVRLKLDATNPSGKKETLNVNILLSEPNGMWHSECTGDICDFVHLVNYSLADTGKYMFTISQDMRVNPLKNTMGIGLRVEKTETK